VTVQDVYAAGRLDFDSEGLLVLTNDGDLIHRLTSPASKTPKTYFVQVKGTVNVSSIRLLQSGVSLKDGFMKCDYANFLDESSKPSNEENTTWLSVRIHSGRNRVVRRLTAAVGYPTIRLIRVSVGPYRLNDLKVGSWIYV